MYRFGPEDGSSYLAEFPLPKRLPRHKHGSDFLLRPNTYIHIPRSHAPRGNTYTVERSNHKIVRINFEQLYWPEGWRAGSLE